MEIDHKRTPSHISPMERRAHITSFYALLDELTARTGGLQFLQSPAARQWPKRGVYFFFEPGEVRTDSGAGPRVVRVGTHGL